MKALEFIYQETQIHFLINPTDKNVMINATEMAKMFNKRIDHFLKANHLKAFLKALEFTPYGGNSEPLIMETVIKTNHRTGTYFNRILALKFAAWLDPSFEVWVYRTIEEITFGNYKKHWEAHAQQEQAKIEMEALKSEMLLNPTTNNVRAYFEAEVNLKSAKQDKSTAIRNQLKLFKFTPNGGNSATKKPAAQTAG